MRNVPDVYTVKYQYVDSSTGMLRIEELETFGFNPDQILSSNSLKNMMWVKMTPGSQAIDLKIMKIVRNRDYKNV